MGQVIKAVLCNFFSAQLKKHCHFSTIHWGFVIKWMAQSPFFWKRWHLKCTFTLDQNSLQEFKNVRNNLLYYSYLFFISLSFIFLTRSLFFLYWKKVHAKRQCNLRVRRAHIKEFIGNIEEKCSIFNLVPSSSHWPYK